MQWSDISFDPPRKTLRQFAALWLIFFGAIAGWQYVQGRSVAALAAALAAVTIGPLGLIRPQLVRFIYVTWMVLAFPIGWVVSRVILGLMFFTIFTPVALLFRLIGRDALHRRRLPARESYWEVKTLPTDMRRYLRQY